jgi:hypothetical protein
MPEDDIPPNVMVDDDDDEDDDADGIDLPFSRDGGGGGSGRGTRPSAAAAPRSTTCVKFDERGERDGSGGGRGDSPTAVEEDAADPDGVASTRVSAAGSIRFRVWATTYYLLPCACPPKSSS